MDGRPLIPGWQKEEWDIREAIIRSHLHQEPVGAMPSRRVLNVCLSVWEIAPFPGSGPGGRIDPAAIPPPPVMPQPVDIALPEDFVRRFANSPLPTNFISIPWAEDGGPLPQPPGTQSIRLDIGEVVWQAPDEALVHGRLFVYRMVKREGRWLVEKTFRPFYGAACG